jgi:hypothetical protein
MGWGFRKALRFGPFRINLSKSGIGASVGVRGARVGINSRGQAYTQVGRGGIFYRQQSSNLFKTRAANQDHSPRLALGTESDYDSFALPLRLATAVVEEIQKLLANVSYPVEPTDDGVTVRFREEFSISIQVVPIDQGSEVRFFLWRHNEDGTTYPVAFDGELGAHALGGIAPIRDGLMHELGGVPVERPPIEESLPSYLGGQQETSPKRSGRQIAMIVVAGIVACSAFIYYAAQPQPQPAMRIATPTPAPSATTAAQQSISVGRIKDRKHKSKSGTSVVGAVVTGVLIGKMLSAQATPTPTPTPTPRMSQAPAPAAVQPRADSGDVHVRSYYRRNGTYVRGYYRRR